MRLLNFLIALNAVNADRAARSVKFADEVGYVAIDKGANCWQKCGDKPNWAGHCSFCALSNGSPGFCCHPDGRGHCSPAMVAALDGTGVHQCVVPNQFTTTSLLQVRQLEHKTECWAKCGKQRNWSGKCGYCGPKGYCCHPDGRGDCPSWISASVTGRRQACMVPSASRNELLFETEQRSDCYDRRETVCKSLDEVVGDFTRCKLFFSFAECMTAVPADSGHHCLTFVDNYCNDITSDSVAERVQQAPRHPLRSFNPYEKELFKFMSTAFSGAADFVYGKIQSTNFPGTNGDFSKMAEQVITSGMAERLEEVNTDRPRLTFAILNALEEVWDFTDGRAFSQIDFSLPAGFTLDQFTRDTFDHMLRSNGASPMTLINLQSQYASFVGETANWSMAQAGVMRLMEELSIDQARLDLVRLANVKNGASADFSLLADSLTNIFDNFRLNNDLSDNDLDMLVEMVQDGNNERVIRNGAMYVELENLMSDSDLWGVPASQKAMERAYATRISGDRYFADPAAFTEDAMTDFMQVAAFYSGAQRHINIKQTAEQITAK